MEMENGLIGLPTCQSFSQGVNMGGILAWFATNHIDIIPFVGDSAGFNMTSSLISGSVYVLIVCLLVENKIEETELPCFFCFFVLNQKR